MRKAITSAVFLLLGAIALTAAPADVTYTEGDASIKLKTGKVQDAQIGDTINTGDTLKTGKDGLAELDQKGVSIKISRNTVFTLMERSQAGQTSPVLSVALGSIKFRYNKLTGQEPMVRTNSMVAGVRGTEFSVFSGADGSTLIAVDSGQVTVESEGKSMDLAASEGTEVPLGKPPGDKFVIHSDQVDYSKWNDDKLAAMLADPDATMQNIEAAMAGYIKDVNGYWSLLKDYRVKLAAGQENAASIRNEKGKIEGDKYADEVVSPLLTQTISLGMNVRFSALAALSLRRYVGGRLYLFLKAQNIAHPDDPAYGEFLSRFSTLLSSFENSIVPYLVKADI